MTLIGNDIDFRYLWPLPVGNEFIDSAFHCYVAIVSDTTMVISRRTCRQYVCFAFYVYIYAIM